MQQGLVIFLYIHALLPLSLGIGLHLLSLFFASLVRAFFIVLAHILSVPPTPLYCNLFTNCHPLSEFFYFRFSLFSRKIILFVKYFYLSLPAIKHKTND